MIRGISFKIQQATENVLWKILKCIDIEKYCWHNIESQNEVWDSPLGEVFFETDFYDGKSFLQRIRLDHYIVFLKLQAYFKNGEFYDVHSYEDFQKSDCSLLLLIWDCEFVNIYVKDEIVAKAIYENALSNSYTEVEYITTSNDGRTKMDVL